MALTGIEIGTPAAGARSGVALSLGSIPVPDVSDESREDAEKTLKKFGFKPVAEDVVVRDGAGTVYAQDPPHSTLRPTGSTVWIFVEVAPEEQPGLEERLTDLKAAIDRLAADIRDMNKNVHDHVNWVKDGVNDKLDRITGKLEELAKSGGTGPSKG